MITKGNNANSATNTKGVTKADINKIKLTHSVEKSLLSMPCTP